MGKRSDKLYMRASEHATSHGGSKAAHRYATGLHSTSGTTSRPLPFDCCALTLQPFVNPVASPSGVVFEAGAIVPYLKDNPICPSTGERLTARDLVTLEMCKEGGEWVCPVTLKVRRHEKRTVVLIPHFHVSHAALCISPSLRNSLTRPKPASLKTRLPAPSTPMLPSTTSASSPSPSST